MEIEKVQTATIKEAKRGRKYGAWIDPFFVAYQSLEPGCSLKLTFDTQAEAQNRVVTLRKFIKEGKLSAKVMQCLNIVYVVPDEEK